MIGEANGSVSVDACAIKVSVDFFRTAISEDNNAAGKVVNKERQRVSLHLLPLFFLPAVPFRRSGRDMKFRRLVD